MVADKDTEVKNPSWDEEKDTLLNHVFKFLGTLDGNSLDIGCGNRKIYPNAIGIDMKRGPTEPWGYVAVPNFIWDVNKPLPFDDETFDWISAIHIIEHLEDPVKCILNWRKKLVYGGLLALIVPDTRFVHKIGEVGGDPTHLWDWTPQTFNETVLGALGKYDTAVFKKAKEENNMDMIPVWRVMAYDTMKNNWSFDVVFRKSWVRYTG